MLSDILTKKEEALQQVLAITENQHSVLTWDKEEGGRELFAQMNARKQELIDAVLQYDGMFDNIFRDMGDSFEKQAPGYADVVRNLQKQIKAVTDLDVKIRVQENFNMDSMPEAKRPNRIDMPKVPVKAALEEYKRHDRKK